MLTKQENMALSSCEAKYMIACAASCQTVWLQDLIGEITATQVPKVVIKVNNTLTIELIKNPIFMDEVSISYHVFITYVKELKKGRSSSSMSTKRNNEMTF